MAKFLGLKPAPEVPPDAEFFNAPQLPTVAAAKGRVLLIYFWAASDLASIAGLGTLEAALSEFGGSLDVIAVHTPRYKGERGAGQVEKFRERYCAQLPLVVDAERQLWNAYLVSTTPCLVFVDHLGNFIMRHQGRFEARGLRETLRKVLSEFDLPIKKRAGGGESADSGAANATKSTKAGAANAPSAAGDKPNVKASSKKRAEATELKFPTKLEYDAGRLYILDSGNARLVVTDAEGKTQHVLSAVEGENLIRPCGVAFGEAAAYLLDAGAGRIAEFDPRDIGGSVKWLCAENAALRLAEDVTFYKGNLYLAGGYSYQVFGFNLASAQIFKVAGTGKLGFHDDECAASLIGEARGVAANGGIMLADSANNAIRVVRPEPGGRTVTLVGGGFHDWGDYDATAREARLAYPCAVTKLADTLYITDTYNHKLKQMQVGSLQVTTLAGSGKPGRADSGQQGGGNSGQGGSGGVNGGELNTPEGICTDGDLIYIADTHNHAIRTFNITTNELKTLAIT